MAAGGHIEKLANCLDWVTFVRKKYIIYDFMVHWPSWVHFWHQFWVSRSISIWLPAAILNFYFFKYKLWTIFIDTLSHKMSVFFDGLISETSRKHYTVNKLVMKFIQNGGRQPYWKTKKLCSLSICCLME